MRAGTLFDLNFVEDLLKKRICPVCFYGEDNKKTDYRWFDIEYFHTPEMMKDISLNGLCKKHGWELSTIGKKLSTLNQYVTKVRTHKLENIKILLEARQKPRI